MKKFQIIIFIIISVFAFIGFKEYNNSFEEDTNNFYSMQKKCIFDNTDEICMKVYESKMPVKLDAYSLTVYVITQTSFRYLTILIPLLMMFIGIKKINKNKLKKELLNIWKKGLILPAIIVFMFLISILVSNNFNYTNTIKSNIQIIPNEFYSVYFIIVYLSVLLLRSIYWLNLGLICFKFSKNKYIASFMGYILFFILALIGEKVPGNYFGFDGIWSYNNISSLALMIISNLLIVGITTFIIYKQYQGKTKKAL